MFTLQAAFLQQRLVESGMPEAQANLIAGSIGNCAQRLEHRGQVAIDGDLSPDSIQAMLEVNLNSNQVEWSLDGGTTGGEGNQDVINGPWALAVNRGPVLIGDHLVNKRFWAVAQRNWVNDTGSLRRNNSYVDCYLATDRAGTLLQRTLAANNSETPMNYPLRVYLPRNGSGLDPNVVSGAVVGYMMGPDGEAVQVCPPYLDGKIDCSIRQWSGTFDDIPAGWAVDPNSLGQHIVGATTGGSTGQAMSGQTQAAVAACFNVVSQPALTTSAATNNYALTAAFGAATVCGISNPRPSGVVYYSIYRKNNASAITD